MVARQPRIAYLVKRIERGLRLQLDVVLSGRGVTTTEYTALSVLRERDGLSSAQVARRSFVTPQAMNLVVIELEKRGLVRRRASESNARTMRMSLTPKGLALVEECDKATLPVEQRFLACLSEPDAKVLRRLLSTCAQSLFEDSHEEESAARSGKETGGRSGSLQGK